MAPVNGYVAPPQSYQALYPPQGYGQAQVSDPNAASFVVRVPDPNAEIWFQNYKTQQRGMVREYESPALNPGTTYTFQMRARWMQNGRPVEKPRTFKLGRASKLMSSSRLRLGRASRRPKRENKRPLPLRNDVQNAAHCDGPVAGGDGRGYLLRGPGNVLQTIVPIDPRDRLPIRRRQRAGLPRDRPY
jgi:uncharacterized protein (TIGR03000 family)